MPGFDTKTKISYYTDFSVGHWVILLAETNHSGHSNIIVMDSSQAL